MLFWTALIVDTISAPGPSAELCEQIRTHHNGSHSTILCILNANTPEVISSYLDSGMNYFITTPYGSEQLRLHITMAEQLIHNISQRVRAEEFLWVSETHFRNLADHSPNMIFINYRGRVVYANRKCEEVMGYSKEEFYSDDFNFLELITPESREIVEKNYRTLLQGGELPPYEYSLLTKEGRKLHAIHTTEMIDYQGDKAILGIVTDITDYRNLLSELEQSENKYRDLLENMSEVVYRLDPQGRITYTSPSVEDFLGYTPDEVMNLTFGDLIYEKDLEKVKANFKKLLNGETMSAEYRILSKLGEIRWMRTSSKPLLDNGEIIAIQGVLSDISEKKKAVEALQLSEERFRSLFENSLIGFYRTTPEGKILWTNPALLQMSGYGNLEEARKLDLQEKGYLNSSARAQFLEAMERDGRVVGLESEWPRKDGSTLSVRESAIAVKGPDGTTLYYEGTAEDISESKRIELELLESEKTYRATLDAFDEAIHLVDTDLRIILLNRIFENWVASLKIDTDIVGSTLPEVFPFLPDKVWEEYDEVLRTGQTKITTETTLLKGVEIKTRTQKRPVLRDGKVARILTIFELLKE